MRKIFLSRSAMTLTELIVASALVGIVTLGLIAAEYTVRMSRQSSARDNLLTTHMQAMMLLLARDVGAVVGDYSDPGIYRKINASNEIISACFRYASGDVNTYDDDRWACWTFTPATGVLLRCNNLNNLIPGAVDDCSGYPGAQDLSTIKYSKLGIAFMDETGAQIDPFGSGYLANKRIGHIRVTMVARYDINKPVHPIENPDYELRYNISPVGLSR